MKYWWINWLIGLVIMAMSLMITVVNKHPLVYVAFGIGIGIQTGGAILVYLEDHEWKKSRVKK